MASKTQESSNTDLAVSEQQKSCIQNSDLTNAQYQKLLKETEKIIEECKVLKENYEEKQKWLYKFTLFSKTAGAVLIWCTSFGIGFYQFQKLKAETANVKNSIQLVETASLNKQREFEEIAKKYDKVQRIILDYYGAINSEAQIKADSVTTSFFNTVIPMLETTDSFIASNATIVENQELEKLVSNLYSENSKERGDAYKTILEKHANEETMTRLLVKAGNTLLNADLEQRRYYMGLNNILATLRSMKSDARKNEKDAIIELCKNAMSKGNRFSYDADRTLNRISR